MRTKMQPQHAVEALKSFELNGRIMWKGDQFPVNWIVRAKLERQQLVKRLEE